MSQDTEEKISEIDSYRVITQDTPNPNALKFIVAKDVKTKGKATYQHPAQCLHVPLASAILGLTSVSQVHLFENVITVTQDGHADWGDLSEEIIEKITQHLPNHNPDFDCEDEVDRDLLSPEILQIEEILDRTIRPGLQADGGDLQVLELTGNILTIKYEGACGSCPSAQAGTLEAIERILRHEFHPEIQIHTL